MNSAGQGHAWAQAITRYCPNTVAANFTFTREHLNFPADHLVSANQFRHDKAWAEAFRAQVTASYTHAILESNCPVFGAGRPDARADIRDLLDAGLGVALLAHGSDVRIPSVFTRLEPWSPFPDLDPEYVAGLERKTTAAVELFSSYSGAVFVSTASLLSFIPNGSWSPVVVRPETWATARLPLEGGRRPVVLHAPSNSQLKGSDLLDPVLAELERQGTIHYRRVSGVHPSEMPDLYHAADIVVDQLGVADYGVAACEAMAAGRIVLSHVAEGVRLHVRERTGLELPIIEATPDNMAEVITRLVDDPETAQRLATDGPAFVRSVHDGRLSVESFASFLDATVETRAAAVVSKRSRGRIVMLVDNSVTLDSRVQKQARSAAARGWNVTLVGRQRGQGRTSWKLGQAKVQLIEVGTDLAQQRHLLRGGHLRSPLAYPRPELASYREQEVRSGRAELAFRRAGARIAGSDAGAFHRRATKINLMVRRSWLALARRWVGLRAEKTRDLYRRRTDMDGALDRWTTSFWRKTMGDRSWRRLDPGLWEWELAYGPVIDRLKPDIIHANDFRMLGVGARATLRARAKGRDVKLVWDAHEFLPGMKPWNPHPRWHVAQQAYEREHARHADAVTTVSETLADLLVAEHGLTTRPTVVLNAPDVSSARASKVNVRESCGVGPDVPLLVYSGAAAPQRGLDTMVEALGLLPDVHVALILPIKKSPYITSLRELAAGLGAEARLHILPYVSVDEIVPFLSGADAGVIPILHFPNHEIALITKFLEYSHARLPIVVSDVKTMADTVRRTGQGEVFEAENLDDFVRAVRAVLAAPDRYRQAYEAPGLLEPWTWEHSAEALNAVYDRLRSDQLSARERATQA